MNPRRTDNHDRLKYQSLARPLTAEERALADAMLAFFRSRSTDFDALARALQERNVARPSGEAGPWTRDVVQTELARINADLDAAYAAHGIGS